MTRRRISPAEQQRRYEEAMAREAALAPNPSPEMIDPPRRLRAVPDIPAEKRARTDDVETARDAAKHVRQNALAWKGLAAHVVNRHDGMTDAAMAIAAFGDSHESYRRRGSDLRALGWIEWLFHEDKPVRRETPIGGLARISIITPAGLAAWESHTRNAADIPAGAGPDE